MYETKKIRNQILEGDVLKNLKKLPDNYFHTVVTSPPYFHLRDYHSNEQIGLERSPNEYLEKIVEVFQEVKRVLRPEGTLWIIIGDSYSYTNWKEEETGNYPIRIHNLKRKDLIGIPWRVAFALQDSGWYLRQDVLWEKPNAKPESVKDRCTRSHEYIFQFSKTPNYFYNSEAISEPALSLIPGHKSFRRSAVDVRNYGRVAYLTKRGKSARTIRERKNKRSVWKITTRASKTSHAATFPKELVETCVKASTSRIGVCCVCGSQVKENLSCGHDSILERPKVLDPFSGSGTTAVVSLNLNCEYTGIELNPVYVRESRIRIEEESNLFSVQIE
ncbi:site-specific DNA-methyltransferase [Leptospira barantonii]|uniref:Methyltransferase n=1 Tax=Leptospira barantonii TaxID=2023184 RepID=A0A5F2BKA9_9LEPT|nr:site-specific DNA-methyltransferase [Leptospira barantonii]TGM06003.1 site-specific DNA-methyltransferase [Leptospira barantonii]